MKSRSAFLEAAGLGMFSVAFAFFLRPAVYNYDGYMYTLDGLAALENISAHHLFWVPIQFVLDAVARRLALEPLLLCQSVGIVISGLFAAVLYLFCYRLSENKPRSLLLVIFLILSPSYWFLARQNLPYIPFFLFVVLALWTCLRYLRTRSAASLFGSVALLSLAVHFQQAAVLLFLPLGIFFLVCEWRSGLPRWGLLSAGVAASLLFVCGPYLGIAYLMDIDTVAEFQGWLTDYLASQHGLQYHWIGVVQTVIGILRCVVQCAPLELRLSRHFSYGQIAAFYSVIGGGVLWGIGCFAKYVKPPLRDQPLYWLTLGFLVTWGFFVFSWEALVSHFWCLDVIVGLVFFLQTAPQWPPRLRRGVAVLLLLASAWNIYANPHQDHLEETRNPDAGLGRIAACVSSRDAVFFLLRTHRDYIDYDLLSAASARRLSDPIKVLLPDLSAPGAIPDAVDHILQSGGKVWLSSWIFDPDAYRDLSGERDIFSPYPMKGLRDIDGAHEFQRITGFLQGQTPATLGARDRPRPLSCHRMRKYLGGAVFLFMLFYYAVSPPLFNYDGYIYRLQGLTPLQSINQTHLVWVPIQWVFWQLGNALHCPSTRFFQALSMTILAFTYGQSLRLWERLSQSTAVAAALTFFIACAPPVWYLGSQNEPYPLLFFCVVSCLWACVRDSASRVLPALLWLSLATLLHQAGMLLCLGFATAFFLTRKDSWQNRLQRAIAWLAGCGFLVGGSYFLVAYLKGIRSLPAFWNWLIGYLHTQHHLQGHWYEDLAKSIVGMVYAVLPLQWHEDQLYAHFSDAQIRLGLLSVAAALMLSIVILLCKPRFQRWLRQCPWREEPVLAVSVALILGWSFFAVFWEPTNYYWAIILFPGLTLIARGMRRPSMFRRWMLASVVMVGVWNLYGDFEQDALNAPRFVDPQLAWVRRSVDKNDRLLFLKQSWHDGVDYDLLGRCLIARRLPRGVFSGSLCRPASGRLGGGIAGSMAPCIEPSSADLCFAVGAAAGFVQGPGKRLLLIILRHGKIPAYCRPRAFCAGEFIL